MVTKFLVENSLRTYTENCVAFRVKGTNIYLTRNLYGDYVSRIISSILAHTPLLTDIIPLIVDYKIDRE